jgi:hypothetical protein
MRTSIVRAVGQSLTLASLVGLVVAEPAHGQLRNPRRPTVGGSPPPARPVPLPPQPKEVRNDLRYRFNNYSLESYNLMSVNHLDRYVSDKQARSYAMDGAGFRLNYDYRPALALTTDVTQSFWGGPFRMTTIELGGHFHPERLEYRVQPFLNLRGSFAHTSDGYAQAVGNTQTAFPPSGYVAGQTFSSGFGGYIGTGMDYGIARNYAITTEIGVSRHRMGFVSVGGQSMGSDWDYNSTAVRFVVGVRYTGGRWIQQDPTMSRPLK